jgi:predicted glycosyltransferase
MRVWVDCTAAAHPLVLRPVIERLQGDGHEVEVTARDYGQTLGVLDRLGIQHTAVGRHGGASRLSKLRALVGRSRALRNWARPRRFDLALAHGSVDLALVSAALRIPAATMFDYEFAALQHHIGCRAARRVLTPDAIPPERLARFGARGEKLAQYPGLKEEYYLADFEPDRAVLGSLGIDPEAVLVVVRPPPEVSMYHAENPLYGALLDLLAADRDAVAVVIPRTEEQATAVRERGEPSLIVPEGEIDAQSLIAHADLVVSAGGTMNREAVSLGTPVYTTFSGRLGAVDERLIAEGRLRPLRDPAELELSKRTVPSMGPGRERTRRDPALLVNLVLGAVA